jgi:hypothetical protein
VAASASFLSIADSAGKRRNRNLGSTVSAIARLTKTAVFSRSGKSARAMLTQNWTSLTMPMPYMVNPLSDVPDVDSHCCSVAAGACGLFLRYRL